MRAVIFANGELASPPKLTASDLVIAADGGGRHCLKHGITPAVVIGDLDSLSDSQVAELRRQGAQIISYPTRKDYTDLELALQYVVEQRIVDVLLVGALGWRWDQTLANLLLAARLPQLNIRLESKDQRIWLLRPGRANLIDAAVGDTVSLIPIRGDVSGITTCGLEYPLCDETLYFGATRGISNTVLQSPAQVSLRQGLLMCITFGKEEQS